MNRFLRDIGYPFLTLIIGGLFIRYFNGYFSNTIQILVISIICFAFGVSIHQGKRSKEWVHKFIVAFFFLFFLFWDMGYVVLPQLKSFFNLIGISGIIIKLFYVFCGWNFFK
ncbi:MAG: hypothetical protein ACK5KQ_03005 [Anaerorhabdus sp.]